MKLCSEAVWDAWAGFCAEGTMHWEFVEGVSPRIYTTEKVKLAT